jgi:hypothetical protein
MTFAKYKTDDPALGRDDDASGLRVGGRNAKRLIVDADDRSGMGQLP